VYVLYFLLAALVLFVVYLFLEKRCGVSFKSGKARVIYVLFVMVCGALLSRIADHI